MTQPTFLSHPTVAHRPPAQKLSAVRSWTADRPGELQPAVEQAGAHFGHPGPSQGFALTIAHRLSSSLVLTSGESHHDVEVGAAAIACRRAALFGRAPQVFDVRLALSLFGFLDTAAPELVALRKTRFSGVSHSYPLQRLLADSIPESTLTLSLEAALALPTDEAIGA